MYKRQVDASRPNVGGSAIAARGRSIVTGESAL
ncbi:hypothetical protein MPC1_11430001 [Methylocella tundrae]|nr:hypothetical protein MPC1_11430001 [Methylocella tundrae]